MPEQIYTTRLAVNDTRQLSKAEMDELDMELIRIKRSNGDTEYATREMIKELEARRKQRRNQRQLAAMQEDKFAQKPSLFRGLFKRFNRG